MKILSLNVNDFGRLSHREEYKKKFGERNYLKEWDSIDKTNIANQLFSYIQDVLPDIVILQEVDIKATETREFLRKLCHIGFNLNGYDNSQRWSLKRPSITAIFSRKCVNVKMLHPNHRLYMRAILVQVEDVVIYGTHVPPRNLQIKGEEERIQDFWREMSVLRRLYVNNKLLLIGDFNTCNSLNSLCVKQMCDRDIVDLADHFDMSDRGTVSDGQQLDYAFVNQCLLQDIKGFAIDSKPLERELTDHKAIIVDI